jgi:hypothetical protein
MQQKVYLSRQSLNSIEFDQEVLKIPLIAGEETSFETFIINYGGPTHIHFSVAPEIRDKVSISQEKVYVIEEEKVAIIIKLPKSCV